MSCENCKYQRKIVLNKSVYPSCILTIPEVTKKCTYVSGYELINKYGRERIEGILNKSIPDCQEYAVRESEC